MLAPSSSKGINILSFLRDFGIYTHLVLKQTAADVREQQQYPSPEPWRKQCLQAASHRRKDVSILPATFTSSHVEAVMGAICSVIVSFAPSPYFGRLLLKLTAP